MTETSSNSKLKVSRHKINEKDSRISCWCLKMDENIFDFFFRISENVTVLFSELCVVFGRSAPSSDCSNDLQVNRHLVQLSSVESLSRVRLLRPHELQHSRPPCPCQLPEFTQTHVHRVGDTIQPSHLLSSPSPPALNLSQHQGLCK